MGRHPGGRLGAGLLRDQAHPYQGTGLQLIPAGNPGAVAVHVDPAYASRTCAECGRIDEANRLSQAWSACRSCGFVDHPDRNGSCNIRAQARELW
ncbi:zinc ribbon domain-containing protein [Streptomyces caeni]|uniref:Zinc ribbon domain-containing protein n=1 Tax=Streptomyces caeni TaxID=2307231 RepID=A0ABW4J4I8_9ACTN